MNWIDRPIQPTKMLRRGGARNLKYGSAAQRKAARKQQRLRAYARAKEEMVANPLATRAEVGIPQPEKIRVPPDTLADAERIKGIDQPTLTGQLMGDPLPGRSALDRLRNLSFE